jgi:proton-translocating NADH-quinone oxidoreductase chain N
MVEFSLTLQTMILLPMLCLFVGAFITYLIGRLFYNEGVPKLIGVVSLLFMLLSLISIYWLYTKLQPPISELPLKYPTPADSNIFLNLRVDALGLFIAAVAVLMGTIVSLYSITYMEKDRGLDRYYPLLLMLVGAIVGLAFVSDVFSLYVFFELMCISSYVLVAFRKDKWEPIEAGFKYIVMSVTGSILVLFGISILFAQTGKLDFASIQAAMTSVSNKGAVNVSIILFIVGFGVKAAIVPLHTWLPDAHAAAPSGISAMLSGIVIEAGFFAMIRVLLMFSKDIGFGLILAIFAVITMTVGNLLALVQTDIKRMLAYSSVTQMGYIVLGIGLGFEYGARAGFEGGLFHIFTHAFMKGLAFLCAGAIIYRIATRNIEDMRGIGRKMPFTAVAFSIAGLALAGVPPLSGFMSKWIIYKAGVDAAVVSNNLTLVVFTAFAVANSVISLGYYLPAINTMFSSDISEKAKNTKEAPTIMLAAIGIMAVITVIIGIYPDLVLKNIGPAVDFIVKLIGGR